MSLVVYEQTEECDVLHLCSRNGTQQKPTGSQFLPGLFSCEKTLQVNINVTYMSQILFTVNLGMWGSWVATGSVVKTNISG